MKNNNRLMPLMLALCLVAGIVIGTFYANHFSGNRLSIINSSGNRINSLLNIINDQYVDEVDIDSLVEASLPLILSELDPHSVYISAADIQIANDELKGSFYGVGIEFVIRDDTIQVQGVVSNGPSERAGILAGDKIVEIDGEPFAGKGITTQEAMHRLRGDKDTRVSIGVKRYGSSKIQTYTVTRGEISQKSITAAYMLDDVTGYIKVKNFGDNTFMEMLVALASLSEQGFQRLVIDLRDNTGGYMEAATRMVNEFLTANKTIVYIEGRNQPRKDYKSDGHGTYPDIPLVVLINEASASASEIFAGAIQDNDRGLVIGRRSFGKGLVQQQIDFVDGSAVRLTIARYYTPSGRCIQKPYSGYDDELAERYARGEFFSQDSIKHTGPEYHTAMGRTVYGGGGITPDIFVSEDTTGMTSYYKQAAMNGLILQFAYEYTDRNRTTLNGYTGMEEMSLYLEKQNLVELFADYAEKHGLKRRNLLIRQSYNLLKRYIVSRIIYNVLDEEDWVEYLNTDDNTIDQALKILKEGKAAPTK